MRSRRACLTRGCCASSSHALMSALFVSSKRLMRADVGARQSACGNAPWCRRRCVTVELPTQRLRIIAGRSRSRECGYSGPPTGAKYRDTPAAGVRPVCRVLCSSQGRPRGGMAEWLMAAVLKTVRPPRLPATLTRAASVVAHRSSPSPIACNDRFRKPQSKVYDDAPRTRDTSASNCSRRCRRSSMWA